MINRKHHIPLQHFPTRTFRSYCEKTCTKHEHEKSRTAASTTNSSASRTPARPPGRMPGFHINIKGAPFIIMARCSPISPGLDENGKISAVY
jgi:hypothetical protein